MQTTYKRKVGYGIVLGCLCFAAAFATVFVQQKFVRSNNAGDRETGYVIGNVLFLCLFITIGALVWNDLRYRREQHEARPLDEETAEATAFAEATY